jgi:hypothetical protein
VTKKHSAGLRGPASARGELLVGDQFELIGIPKWALLKAAALASASCGGVSVALGSLGMCVMFVTVAWCMLWRLE